MSYEKPTIFENALEWVFDNIFPPLALFLLATALGVAIYTGYVLIAGPKSPTFELKKDEWNCTNTYEVRRFNGKYWYNTTECSQWSRKGIE